MLSNAIEIREIMKGDADSPRYELYDSDTGTSMGVYDTYERADAERRNLQSSDDAAYRGGTDADPGPE